MLSNELKQRSFKFVSALMQIIWVPLRSIFRIEIEGSEHIPKTGPFMFISNHNAGAVIESHSLLFLALSAGRTVYGLNHPAIFKIPLVGKYFRKIGAVIASKEAGAEVLDAGHGLLIFPGGNRQALRPFSKRHDNTFPWAKGWADIALDSGSKRPTPVIPVKFIGSHSVNPILACNTAISKFLILPHLLGAKWFPISCGQILYTFLTVAALNRLDAPASIQIICGYVAFIASCLLPVMPAKIKIKIYRPILPTSRAALLGDVNEIMRRCDFPSGIHNMYRLNGIERFMLQHESAEVRYNSHVIFEFLGTMDPKLFLNTTNQWINLFPHVRSSIEVGYYRSQRYTYKDAWFDASDIITFSNILSDAEVDDFCHRKFELAFQAPVRFLLQSESGKNRFVFSCHHSLLDGLAQASLMEEWIHLYNGQTPSSMFLRIHEFHFRSALKYFGIARSLAFLRENFGITPPRTQTQIATLVQPFGTESRKVKAKTFRIGLAGTVRKDFYAFAIKSVAEVLLQTNENEKPLLFYLPSGLRWILKVKDSLQNVVVSHVVYLKRDQIASGKLGPSISAKLAQDLLEANSKFIFGVLPLCALAPESYMRKAFTRLDSAERPSACTALLVNAPAQNSFPEGSGWSDTFISARGTLLRTPALGILLTGKKGRETITVEFVDELVSEAHVDQLIEKLKQELSMIRQPHKIGGGDE